MGEPGPLICVITPRLPARKITVLVSESPFKGVSPWWEGPLPAYLLSLASLKNRKRREVVLGILVRGHAKSEVLKV